MNAFEQAVGEFRVSYLLREVTRRKGNVSAAARAVGVHRNTVRRILLDAGYDSRRLVKISRIHNGVRKPPASVAPHAVAKNFLGAIQQPKKEKEKCKLKEKTGSFGIGSYVIVRTYSAGVLAGNLESRDGREAVLANVRRLWYWSGAGSLSQLAVSGVSKPKDCKFSVTVPRELLTEVIEILETTPEAEVNIKAVPEWRA